MTQAATADWEPSLAAWLAPFLEALGHKVRQRWAPVYVLVGLRPPFIVSSVYDYGSSKPSLHW